MSAPPATPWRAALAHQAAQRLDPPFVQGGEACPEVAAQLVGTDLLGRVLVHQQELDVAALPVGGGLLDGEAVQCPPDAEAGQDEGDGRHHPEGEEQRFDGKQGHPHGHHTERRAADRQQPVGHLQRPDGGVDDGALEAVVETRVLEAGQVRPAGGVDDLLGGRAGDHL